jgi:hypothetical protein
MRRIIFTNTTKMNNNKYISGFGVGGNSSAKQAALRHSESNACSTLNRQWTGCCISAPDIIVNNCPTKEVNGGTFSTQSELETLRGCTKINGGIEITNFVGQPDFTVFDCLQEITGYLDIYENAALITISGFPKLTTLSLEIFISNNHALTTIANFLPLMTALAIVVLYINNNHALTTLDNFLPLLTTVKDLAINNNHALTTLDNFLPRMTTINQTLTISGNTALTTLANFLPLITVVGTLTIHNNPALTSLANFLSLATAINGTLTISGNTALTTLDNFLSVLTAVLAVTISDNPDLTSLANFLPLVTAITGDLTISGNTALTNLSNFMPLVISIGRSLTISGNTALTNLSNFMPAVTAIGSINQSQDASVDGLTISDNTDLRTLSGLSTLSTLYGNFKITNNGINAPNPNNISFTITDFIQSLFIITGSSNNICGNATINGSDATHQTQITTEINTKLTNVNVVSPPNIYTTEFVVIIY